MVRHEAIAQEAEATAAAPVSEQAAVRAAVKVVEENGLAVVPPLRDVVRYADRDHARDAWHGCFQGSIVAGGQSRGFSRWAGVFAGI
jgi:hypothetical protein